MASREDIDHEQQKKTDKRKELEDVMRGIDVVIEHNRRLVDLWVKANAQLMQMLIRVRSKLHEHKKQRSVLNQKPSEHFRYINVGKPYFKDRDLNPPPDNEDTIIMNKCGMFDFSNVMTVSGWTVGDKGRLISCLLDMSKAIIRKQIVEEITELQRSGKKDKATTCNIAELRKEIILLKNKKLEDLDLPVDQEFDWEEVAMKLNRRHSPREYKAIWSLFFHPKINKSAWSREEHHELQRLAAEKNLKDWDSIAKALHTGRTGYQCFVYFRTNVSHTGNGRKWTKDEMDELQRVINLYMEEHYIPWGKVAATMKKRTKIQCYNKYMRMIEGRKGRFLPEEDAVILNFVNVYGTDFRKMASFLTGRSAVQLRVRYNLLNKIRVSTTWTAEDDKKLLQIMANQDSRFNFSTATKHFPGKDRQNIRSRYLTLVKWMKTHPFNDVSAAPRRGARRLVHGEATSNLVKAIADLDKRMEEEIEKNHEEQIPVRRKLTKYKKLTRMASHAALNDGIMSQVANIQARESRPEVVMRNTQLAKADDTFMEVQLQEITTTPRETSNLLNMRQCLYILNAIFPDKDKFYKSNAGKGFDSLDLREAEATLVKVKSYSKKAMVQSVEMFDKPDLFGRQVGRRRFFFPPNFASVTGSRVLLSYLTATFSGKEREDLNIKMITKKNYSVFEHLTKLHERFTDLFTWPFILSNEAPEVYEEYTKNVMKSRAAHTRKPKNTSSKIVLPNVPGVTIPPPPPKRLCIMEDQDTIDTTNDNDINDITMTVDMDDELNMIMG